MKTSALLIFAILILSSCSKVMYMPNTINAPLFNERNEFKANVSMNNFQAAFAPASHFGIMANGYTRSSNYSSGGSSSDINYSSSRNLFEGGIGYFNTLSEGFVYEIYGGGGVGSLTYNGDQMYSGTGNVIYKYSADFSRFFIQPSIGFSHDIVDVSISARIVRLSFNNIRTENYTQQMLINEDIYNLDQSDYFFIEPALTFRVGYKWCKFQTQLLYSNKLNLETLNYKKFTVSAGLQIDIAPRFKTNKQK